ncbi:MAG: TraB/GumN family protein [Gemmatimonadales bacterium]|nr:MAG: TraB/GumN family protein [Gemmatimonadales bacterium]
MDETTRPTALEASHGDEPVERVTRDGIEYTLLGTAHVSRKSAETVRRMIDEGDYDAVAVELCPTRHRALTDPTAWQELDIFRILREGKASMMMATLALGAYQRRIASQFGIEPGAEMKAAIESADALDLPLQLVDRDIGITLRRASRRLPWWQRYTMVVGIFVALLSKEEITEDEIERLKEGDILEETFRELSDGSPALHEALVAERDRYMAARLRQENPGREGGRVLVVVGAGHMQGLKRALEEDDRDPAAEVASLAQSPDPSRLIRALPWLFVALILTGFVLGFMRSPELGWALVATWVLANGTLSALGALLARGHPLTIFSAFAAAPLTSLNPTIGAGVVTASVEAGIRKPTMGDFETLRDDVTELGGWRSNRVARIFLVFALSSLGSVLGSWLAGARMVVELF